MAKAVSNFAALMDLLELRAQEVVDALGTDASMISRWRTGGRKLMRGRHWVMKVSKYFLSVDAASGKSLIPALIAEYYPLEKVEQHEDLDALLQRWLCEPNQTAPSHIDRRELVLFHIKRAELNGTTNFSYTDIENKSNEPLKSAIGDADVRESMLSILDIVLTLNKPCDIIFVCPEGLALLTREEKFGKRLMQKLNEVFRAGFTLKVVLRTDYRMSDISAFSGAWLVAHLRGYIKSYYYDDFRLIETDKMLIAVENYLAVRVWDNDAGKGVEFAMYNDQEHTSNILEQCGEYLNRSVQRFHYNFFKKPEGFLKDEIKLEGKPIYMFSKLPQFGLRNVEYLESLGLNKSECEKVEREFAPFLITPDSVPDDVQLFYIYSTDAIDETLDKPKHLSFELTDICGRRVYISTQEFVDQIKAVKTLMDERPNFHACFLPEEMFQEIAMSIGVYGNEAAIGWIPGEDASACKDYILVGALQGYCAIIWDRIPAQMRTRRKAAAKMNIWLRRAKKFGLNV